MTQMIDNVTSRCHFCVSIIYLHSETSGVHRKKDVQLASITNSVTHTWYECFISPRQWIQSKPQPADWVLRYPAQLIANLVHMSDCDACTSRMLDNVICAACAQVSSLNSYFSIVFLNNASRFLDHICIADQPYHAQCQNSKVLVCVLSQKFHHQIGFRKYLQQSKDKTHKEMRSLEQTRECTDDFEINSLLNHPQEWFGHDTGPHLGPNNFVALLELDCCCRRSSTKVPFLHGNYKKAPLTRTQRKMIDVDFQY